MAKAALASGAETGFACDASTGTDCHDQTAAPDILKFHVWAPSFTEFGGGIGVFSQELALGLTDLGHEVDLVGKTDATGSWNGLAISGAGSFRGRMRTVVFGATALRQVARRKPDHVISTHVNFGPVAHVAKRTLGTGFTVVAHGIDVHSGLPRATLAALRAANRIVVVSEWTRQRVLSLQGIDGSRIVRLPNTLDESRFTTGLKSSALRERYRLEPDDKVILTVARLDGAERYKGYDRIVSALPALRNRFGKVRFLIVGMGSDRSRIEAVAQTHGVVDAITFAGFVGDSELADHYRLADVFAMPSAGEGFGIVFLESMACGTPVLAGNKDGSVDALDNGRLGKLVDPEDVNAIANGIADLLDRRGPDMWFDPEALHAAVVSTYGRAAFRKRLNEVFAAMPIP
ncbi:MAG TPA: glycosyltransferase family 4 protein [Gemmatimonadaceae bacterium]|nr:glycosyltransferase family 4 protein [Gemmatimonadaceae bacterium]